MGADGERRPAGREPLEALAAVAVEPAERAEQAAEALEAGGSSRRSSPGR